MLSPGTHREGSPHTMPTLNATFPPSSAQRSQAATRTDDLVVGFIPTAHHVKPTRRARAAPKDQRVGDYPQERLMRCL